MRRCSVEGCDSKHVARGYCRKHYGRWWSGNDVLEKSRYEKSVAERFLESFERRGNDECWEWQRCRSSFGHGSFWIGTGLVGAHRFSYEHFNGSFDPDLCVLHRCDNPPCVNPKHLFLGTKLDNTRDCIEKGRRPDYSGERNGRAKLTDADVIRIRELVRAGMTRRKAAEIFGVSKTVIGHIIKGKLWSHVPAHVTQYRAPTVWP